MFGLQYYKGEERLVFEHLKDSGGCSTEAHNSSHLSSDSFVSVSPSAKAGKPLAWKVEDRFVGWLRRLGASRCWQACGPLLLHVTEVLLSVYLSFFCFLQRPPKLSFEVHLIVTSKKYILIIHRLQIPRHKAGPMEKTNLLLTSVRKMLPVDPLAQFQIESLL